MSELCAALCHDIEVELETLDELEEGGSARLACEVDVTTILRACSNLVESIGSESPIFRFTHLTVQEYLVQQGWMPAAHTYAAEKCLRYHLDMQNGSPCFTKVAESE